MSALDLLLLLAIGLLAALQLWLSMRLNVNWDEFHFLDKVYRLTRGELRQPLQSFYVHLFRWVPAVGGNELQQVLAARAAVFLLHLGCIALTWTIARRYVSSRSALFAVLCYSAFSYTLLHGTSFRFDPIASFFFLASLASLTATWRLVPRLVLAGLWMAIAFLVTIKAILVLPVCLGTLLVHEWARTGARASVRGLLIYGTALGGSFLLLFVVHAWTLRSTRSSAAGALISNAGRTVIRFGDLFPAGIFLARTLAADTTIWIAIAGGFTLSALSLRRTSARSASNTGMSARQAIARDAALLLYALPLGSVLFYRNSFPYFYVFILTPAVVLSGVFYERLQEFAGRRSTGVEAALILLITTTGIGHFAANKGRGHEAQAQLIDAVHRIFPDPVPYLDRTEMIASFPKVGLFMSTWGVESYRRAGKPRLRQIISDEQPPLLIADHPALNPLVPWDSAIDRNLFREDHDVLRASYVHHWGHIFVAGAQFDSLGAGGREFEVLVGGTYTVEAEAAIVIDDIVRAPGALVSLTAGAHRIHTTDDRRIPVILRWGANLVRPTEKPLRQDLFTGF